MQRLGHEVWYIEDSTAWPYDPIQNTVTDDGRYAVAHVARKLAGELDEGVVVCILADGGWKYLSADFWDSPDVAESMERTVWW